MKTLTIRNVPEDMHEALLRERSRTDRSLNQTVIDLLRQRLAVGGTPSNGLGRMAGGWSDDELRAFEAATASFEAVDPEVWG
jgi:plasmid stability protein